MATLQAILKTSLSLGKAEKLKLKANTGNHDEGELINSLKA